jgi:medium-chain acyl-[acyl-carrier-protein] hydrolase
MLIDSKAAENPWLFRPRPVRDPALRLFLFPHAGRGASIFRLWPEYLPPDVEVCAVELPGREQRLRDRPYTRMEPLVAALEQHLTPYLDVPFALFGHSFGASVAFELARKLRHERLRRLFVSARRAPREPGDGVTVHALPDAQLVARILKMGGTPSGVLDDPELRALFAQIIRADFSVMETNVYRPQQLLDVPITALCGTADSHASREQVASWRHETSAEFDLHVVEGGHFFLHTALPQVAGLVAQALIGSR